ncbi:MAG TPA: MotA/TolQ/ExbB proton channel family protein [Gemmataceae bacterium]|nr:MotA/TolQ/ExbB proton channel family protein [Gemmataceae bacterium]
MQSLAAGKVRSLILSALMGLFIFGMVGGMSLVVGPNPAFAQQEGENPAPPEGDAPKEKVNPVVHFFKSIGIVFGLIFAAISIGMVALIIILLLDLRLGESVPPAFVEEFTEMVNKRQFKQAYELCRNESTFIARVLTAGMGRLQYGIEDAREAMITMVDAVRAGKDSWISYLGIIGTLGPLLGLVGTVSGMIGAFRKLGESDKAPEASALASEISHALVVTLVGVAIACPAIFFFTFFKNRLTNISVQTSNLADDLLTQMYHNSKKTGGAGATMAATERSAEITSKR